MAPHTPRRSSSGLTYREAGVDIEAGDEAVRRIGPLAGATHRPEVLGGIGAFASFVRVPAGYTEPVLVSSTDGVGTKLKVAFAADRHDTVGIDLVAMSVNDVLVHGAEPLYFLDYIGIPRVDPAPRGAAGRRSGRGVPAGRLCARRWRDRRASGPLRARRVRSGRLRRGRRRARAHHRRRRREAGRRRPRPGLLGAALQRLHPGPAHRLRRDGARPRRRCCPAPGAPSPTCCWSPRGSTSAPSCPCATTSRDGPHHRRRDHRQPAPRAAGGLPGPGADGRVGRAAAAGVRARCRRPGASTTPRCSARSTWASAT